MRLWYWFLARLRLSNVAICEMSRGRNMFNDYHDYPDAQEGPQHFVVMTCKRCGKEFYI